MSLRRIVVVVSAVFVLFGVVLLFPSVSAYDAQSGGTACGSAISPDRSEPDPSWSQDQRMLFDRLRSQCDARIARQWTSVAVLVGLGVVGLVGAAVWRRSPVAVHEAAHDEREEHQAAE